MRRLPRAGDCGIGSGDKGTLELAVVATGVGLSIIPLVLTKSAKLYVTTFSTMQTSRDRIQTYRDSYGDTRRRTRTAMCSFLVIGMPGARGLRYHMIGPRDFEIRSAGPDGIFDNSDDQRMEYGGAASSLPSAWIEPAPER